MTTTKAPPRTCHHCGIGLGALADSTFRLFKLVRIEGTERTFCADLDACDTRMGVR